MRKQVKWIMVRSVLLLFIGGMLIYPYIKNALQSTDNSIGTGGPARAGKQRQILNINATVMKTQLMAEKQEQSPISYPMKTLTFHLRQPLQNKIHKNFHPKGRSIKSFLLIKMI